MKALATFMLVLIAMGQSTRPRHRNRNGGQRGEQGQTGKDRRQGHMKEKECQIMLDLVGVNWAIPTCPKSVGRCFKKSHKLAEACIRKEKGEPTHRNCQKNPIVKAAKMAWFAESCRWHQAIVNCSGTVPIPERITEIVKTLESGPITARPGSQTEPRAANRKCWRRMDAKVRECTLLATRECTNFAACSGIDAPPATPESSKLIADWFLVSSKFREAKNEKLREFKLRLHQCSSPELRPENAEAQDRDTDEVEETAASESG